MMNEFGSFCIHSLALLVKHQFRAPLEPKTPEQYEFTMHLRCVRNRQEENARENGKKWCQSERRWKPSIDQIRKRKIDQAHSLNTYIKTAAELSVRSVKKVERKSWWKKQTKKRTSKTNGTAHKKYEWWWKKLRRRNHRTNIRNWILTAIWTLSVERWASIENK